MKNFTLTVRGVPRPQGSKRHIGNGVMIESCKDLAAWRKLVTLAAMIKAKNETGLPLCGPLWATFQFTLPCPKRMPRGRTHPSVKPDLSKLVRAVEDSLTDARVIDDDARIVGIRATKVYTQDPEDRVGQPGVYVHIMELQSEMEQP